MTFSIQLQDTTQPVHQVTGSFAATMQVPAGHQAASGHGVAVVRLENVQHGRASTVMTSVSDNSSFVSTLTVCSIRRGCSGHVRATGRTDWGGRQLRPKQLAHCNPSNILTSRRDDLDRSQNLRDGRYCDTNVVVGEGHTNGSEQDSQLHYGGRQ